MGVDILVHRYNSSGLRVILWTANCKAEVGMKHKYLCYVWKE